MPNTLKGSDYLYHHPKKRAEDLMAAFSDTSIKGIFSCIGGEESIRILPYIDFKIIKNNPKIFIGYSDTTVSHFICLKENLSSFYGASLLAELAENIKIFDYTAHWLKKVLFETSPIGQIPAAKEWTGERIEWFESNSSISKNMIKNKGYEFLQREGIIEGPLIGGCMEVLEMIKGTTLWPSNDVFKDVILFFETSENMTHPTYVEYWFRNYGTQGILQNSKAIIFGNPYQEKYYKEYKNVIMKIISELELYHIPIIYKPMMCIPYGAMAEIDCNKKSFSIIESGVI